MRINETIYETTKFYDAEMNGYDKNYLEYRRDLSVDELEKIMMSPIKFKTGGFRGLMMHGYSNINPTSINVAVTAVIKEHLKVNSETNQKIFIGYDGRHNSHLFALLVAEIFHFYQNSNKERYFDIFIHKKPTITPYVSFCVTELGCSLGVMITASHNPKDYNGIKIYSSSGSQICSPFTDLVEEEAQKKLTTHIQKEFYHDMFRLFSVYAFDRYKMKLIERESFLYESGVAKNPIQKYDQFIEPYTIRLATDFVKPRDSTPRIYFSSLYGASHEFVKLANDKFNLNFCFDEKTCHIDPNFTLFNKPNPEHRDVFYELFSRTPEDVNYVFVTDPDGDRFGMAVRCPKNKPIFKEFSIEKFEEIPNKDLSIIGTESGIKDYHEWKIYDADEIALIMAHYLLSQSVDIKSFVFINTVFCSPVFENYCANRNLEYYCSLKTGFKEIMKIANKVKQKRKNDELFFLAYEDPLGFLFGKENEKNGITVALLIAQIINKINPELLLSKINEMIPDINYCKTKVNYEGDPKKIISDAMEMLVDDEAELAREYVSDCHIYRKNIDKKTNYYVRFRISGTEPIIKFYATGKGMDKKALQNSLNEDIKKYFMSK
ncbi:hypothetical protein EDEG_03490 [Edhazardia aedis USNM 41457]|uniref:Uncharacterized protein n=1 Tax=Edhazardia aedis (strain USNM 41457) TaxID=1003232 RepID=J9D2P3_EDHAE|nr:hypothetical protein EDEG_03490 [Edhazardia aedis USNM 41457]|eukprot:EJW02066.1 hypothetical protein EDEG_03490 [Edhazardia aedis USNM 41457]